MSGQALKKECEILVHDYQLLCLCLAIFVQGYKVNAGG